MDKRRYFAISGYFKDDRTKFEDYSLDFVITSYKGVNT